MPKPLQNVNSDGLVHKTSVVLNTLLKISKYFSGKFVENLIFIEKIETGSKQSENGEVIPESEMENEIKKFFNDMIHTPNPKVNFEVNGDIITIKELNVKKDEEKDEEEKKEDKCDKIDIELPKNISYIPFKTEAKSNIRYSLIEFKKGKHFECCKSGNPLCGKKDNKKA